MQQIFDTGTGAYATEAEIAQARRDGMLFLRAKMVYKLKFKTIELPDGTLRDVPHIWKARLAAVGSREREGLDFANSTFSPTIGMTAVRTLVALCCDPKFDLRSYDLSGAYLGTPLTRPVFIILPPDAGEDPSLRKGHHRPARLQRRICQVPRRTTPLVPPQRLRLQAATHGSVHLPLRGRQRQRHDVLSLR